MIQALPVIVGIMAGYPATLVCDFTRPSKRDPIQDSLIKIYSPEGDYLHAIPWDGELSGFTVAQDGVYVAKNNEYTIHKYDFNDKLMYRFGAKGEGRVQFKNLAGLAIAKDRQVVVADDAKGVVNFSSS